MIIENEDDTARVGKKPYRLRKGVILCIAENADKNFPYGFVKTRD